VKPLAFVASLASTSALAQEPMIFAPGEPGTLKAGDTWVFPPLWGEQSYSAGAGMHKVPIAAAFIKTKMPYKHGNTLTDSQAWDVAASINSKPRRFVPRSNRRGQNPAACPSLRGSDPAT